MGPVVLEKVLEKNIFKCCQSILVYFAFISPWKRVWPLISSNLNSHHRRMLYAKFLWNWLSGSGHSRDDFVKCVFPDSQYIPSEKMWAFILEFPSFKNDLWQVWFWSNLAQWFWRRTLKVVNVCSLFCYYLT